MGSAMTCVISGVALMSPGLRQRPANDFDTCSSLNCFAAWLDIYTGKLSMLGV